MGRRLERRDHRLAGRPRPPAAAARARPRSALDALAGAFDPLPLPGSAVAVTLNVKPTLADLRTLALAAVGLVAPDSPAEEPVWTADMLGPCVAAIRTAPDEKDRRLVELA